MSRHQRLESWRRRASLLLIGIGLGLGCATVVVAGSLNSVVSPDSVQTAPESVWVPLAAVAAVCTVAGMGVRFIPIRRRHRSRSSRQAENVQETAPPT